MLKPFKLTILLFVVLSAFLSACNGVERELSDGDQQVTEEMNQVISDHIVQKYSSFYKTTEKQFEVHKIYGTSASKGVISVYIWSYYGGFNQATGTENQSGHSLPAVIRLKKDNEQYSVVEYIEPEDGSLYQSSLRRMFPKRYLKLAQQDQGNIKELQKEMDQKVEKWLEV